MDPVWFLVDSERHLPIQIVDDTPREIFVQVRYELPVLEDWWLPECLGYGLECCFFRGPMGPL